MCVTVAADNRSLVQTDNVTELQHVAELLGAIWKDEMSAWKIGGSIHDGFVARDFTEKGKRSPHLGRRHSADLPPLVR